MSFLQFTKNGHVHTDKLSGDNDLHIFNIDLTNVYLDKYNELINEHVEYDDIVVLHLFKNDDIITRLPNNLKSLYIKCGTLEQLPISDIVAQNIENICLDFTNVEVFPDISKCIRLTELTINHSNLQSVMLTYNLPPNLKVLNVRYNNIHEIDFSIFKTHQNLKINLSYNKLNNSIIDDILMINRKTEIKMQNNYLFRRINANNYNVFEIRNLMINIENNRYAAIRNQTNSNNDMLVVRNILEGNSQTVHLSSINNTVKSSYKNMQEYVKNNRLRIKPSNIMTIDEICNVFLENNLYDVSSFLTQKLDMSDSHSILKIKYIELLAIVWTIIDNHPQRVYLIERLHSEIMDSIGKCFTGCINRLINVLVGYLEGVVISISLKEEIQMSIQLLMSKLMNFTIDYNTTKQEIVKILNQKYDVDLSDKNNIISDEYKESWLNALEDYRPNAILCNIDNNTHIIYYISYDNLVYNSHENFDKEENPIGKILEKNKIQLFSDPNNKHIYSHI